MSLFDARLVAAVKSVAERTFQSDSPFVQSITIRRGNNTLPAQWVRLTNPSGARSVQGGAAQQEEASVTVVGPTALDIQAEDRFNDEDGTLYQVFFVHPNRDVQTVAEARAKQ